MVINLIFSFRSAFNYVTKLRLNIEDRESFLYLWDFVGERFNDYLMLKLLIACNSFRHYKADMENKRQCLVWVPRFNFLILINLFKFL